MAQDEANVSAKRQAMRFMERRLRLIKVRRYDAEVLVEANQCQPFFHVSVQKGGANQSTDEVCFRTKRSIALKAALEKPSNRG